jgi:hypothetical protein
LASTLSAAFRLSPAINDPQVVYDAPLYRQNPVKGKTEIPENMNTICHK